MINIGRDVRWKMKKWKRRKFVHTDRIYFPYLDQNVQGIIKDSDMPHKDLIHVFYTYRLPIINWKDTEIRSGCQRRHSAFAVPVNQVL